MTMANSLESRAPFLDKDLVEFAMTIPDNLKIRGLTTKYVLRKAMADMIPDFVFKKPKWGFTFVPHRQFKKDLQQTARRLLNEQRIKEQGLFNYEYIKSILDYEPRGSMQWHYWFIWTLVGFQIWHDLFISRVASPSEMTEEIALSS